MFKPALLAALLVMTGPAPAGPLEALLGPDPQATLPPERAFSMRVVAQRSGARLEINIAPGHYLYKDRLRARPAGGGALILTLPAGEPVEDEAFGRVEVYRGRLDIDLGVHSGLPAGTREIEVDYQGCAEGRLCYPPARRMLPVEPA